MAYDVNKTDGTRLVIVPDRQVESVGGIRLLGKNFSSYGEIMAENLVSMLENFASPTAPENPIPGQLWFDTSLGNASELKFYFNDTVKWVKLRLDLKKATVTGWDYSDILDTTGVYHKAAKFKVNGIIIFIASSDSTYTPHSSEGLTDFASISPGINFNGATESTDGANAPTDLIYKLRGRAIEAEFADMAEIYTADMELVPGNIVKLGGAAEITKTTEQFDNQVFGIVSTAPGFLLNSKDKMKEFAYPVALKGRVPCVVKGEVKKGQRIVASDLAGVGMATDDFDPAATVGRAISAKTNSDVGLIEVAVGVR